MSSFKEKRTFLRRVIKLFRPFWKYFAVVFFIQIVVQLIGTFSPYIFGKAVDTVATGNAALTFLYIGTAFVLTVFTNTFLGLFRDLFELRYIDNHVDMHFSVYSLKKMLGFSVGQHINEHSGVRQGVVNKGQGSLSTFMERILYGILPSGVQVAVTLGIMAVFDWRVAALAFVFVVLYLVITYRRNIKFYPLADRMRKMGQDQNKLQSELFRNTTLVISEAQEQKVTEDYRREYQSLVDVLLRDWGWFMKSSRKNHLLLDIGQYGALALGVYFILIGQHSAGMFVTLFAWTGAIFSSLSGIMAQQRLLLSNIVDIKKYFELLDIKPDIDLNVEGRMLSNLEGKIVFKNVSFAYPYRYAKEEEEETAENKKEDRAVADVSLTIPAGAKVGFVGVSGSGKSTIVNLLRRFYDPTSGTILVDGEDLKELDLRWLRSRIGNVEQKIELFDRSIRDNILFGLPEDKRDVGEEALQKAVDDASLGDFVAKLKDHGLDTMIGENGIKVSGGERQRIGIARALIKNPKILIFDEATSALDSINEKLIHDAINRGSKGRTTIIIAHRLSTIMDADIIFVVANGKIVDSGKHKELIKRCAEYQDLVKNQVLAG